MSHVTEFLAAAGQPEKPSPFQAEWDFEANFRHGSWQHDRSRVITALSQLPDQPTRRLSAFKMCGAGARILRQAVTNGITVHRYRLSCTKCHDRFCVPCANERARLIRGNLLDYIRDKPNLSLITLTLQQSDDPLAETLDRINLHFKTLRATKLWKNAITGGCAIIENKLSASGRWHLHMHIIADAKFLQQRDLSKAWHDITGDSYIVDIRRVGARSGAVSYITKYVTKAADASVVRSPEHIKEAISAYSGRRLITTFAKWRGLKLSQKGPIDDVPTEATKGPWEDVGSLHETCTNARKGDPAALAALAYIRNPLDRRTTLDSALRPHT